MPNSGLHLTKNPVNEEHYITIIRVHFFDYLNRIGLAVVPFVYFTGFAVSQYVKVKYGV